MNVDNPQVQFSLRLKLFLLVSISFSLLIAITIWRIDIEADAVANNAINKSIQRSRVIINSDLENRFRSIGETAISLSRDGRILPRVFEEDSETLQDLTYEFKEALEFDILIFTNADGVIIARSDNPNAIGRSLQGRSTLFDSALSGNKATGIMATKNQLLQIVAVPVFDNVATDFVRGTVALAYRLTELQAKEIHQLTESEIGIFQFSKNKSDKQFKPVNRFFTNPDLIDPVNQFFSENSETFLKKLAKSGEISELTLNLGEETFHSVLYPLNRSGGSALGFILAIKSRTELLKPFKMIQQQILIIGGICLFLASLIAWAIAHGISKPIISLVSITQRIQEGNYPQPDARFYHNRDEAGLLYQAIYQMGKNLKDKNQLENYLSQVSDSLDLLSKDDEIKDLIHKPDNEPVESSAHYTLSKKDPNEVLERTTLVLDNPVIEADEATEGEFNEESEPLVLGSVFAGRYKIIKALGRGAIGSVHLVNDQDLNEQVALKIFFNKNLKGDQLSRFKEEIRLARRITHRNILRTFDFGVWQNRYYITMEYINGFDLNSLIRQKGILSPEIAIIMGRQICSAIIAAHDEGIIHRDLKPTNIIINRQGVLKIMDFGLAIKINHSDTNHESQNDNTNGTGIAGTPRYMAPEQFEGKDLDERTDIYAIGGILFFILTGRSAYDGKSYSEIAEQHRNKTVPSLTELQKNIPLRLEQIVFQALAKKKTDRYQSVTELHNDLMDLNTSTTNA